MEPVGSGFIYYGYIFCFWEMGLGKISRKNNGAKEEKSADVTSCL